MQEIDYNSAKVKSYSISPHLSSRAKQTINIVTDTQFTERKQTWCTYSSDVSKFIPHNTTIYALPYGIKFVNSKEWIGWSLKLRNNSGQNITLLTTQIYL